MSGLFSKPKTAKVEPVKVPEIKPPAPIPDEEALKKGRKKSMARSRSRTGRRSTILSQGETLG